METSKLCQICFQDNRPLKGFPDNNWVHVTCLILFNFAHLMDKKVTLRSAVNFDYIKQMVYESTKALGACEICHRKEGCFFNF